MAAETARSRLVKVMRGEMPEDRLPLMEWATWWGLTLERWRGEGLPADLDNQGIKQRFGLDVDCQLWFSQFAPGTPDLNRGEGKGLIDDEAGYDAILQWLYPAPVPYNRDAWKTIAEQHERGEVIVWISLSGFFWWPRQLFGIEPHLYAFYDYPELMQRINQDQVRYMHRCLDSFCQICTPDFMTFGEDMSYNHGPMISKDLYDEFMAPCYRQIVPRLKELGITPLIDSDGDVEPLIPWFEGVGLEGILPLERMAGVDVNRIREAHPEWKMVGGFDKTVMHLGEERMRQEFERLLPAMHSGRFVPSVDHQTPPAVSIQDYELYLKLLREYAEKAVRQQRP